MTRKIISGMLAVLLGAVMTISCGMFAIGSDPSIVVGTASADAGDRISVDVSIVGNPGITAYILSIKYDTSRLLLESVEQNTALGGRFEYLTKVVWMSSGDTSFDGTIFTLNFKVLDSAAIGEAEITLSYEEGDICNYNEKSVDFDIVSGGITVVNGSTETGGTVVNEVTPGDAASDLSEIAENSNTKKKESSNQTILIIAVVAVALIAVSACAVAVVKSKKKDGQ